MEGVEWTQDASWTEGASTTEDNAKHDVSDHRASVMYHARGRILATTIAESAEDTHHALKPTSVQQPTTGAQVEAQAVKYRDQENAGRRELVSRRLPRAASGR